MSNDIDLFEGTVHHHEPVGRQIPKLSDAIYIQYRVEDQLKWHKRKSEINNRKFNLLKNIDTMIAAVIPIAMSIHASIGGGDGEREIWELGLKIFAAAAGVWLAISSGFFELEGYEHRAKDYKRLYQNLETERFKYLTRTEPYDESDAYQKLVLNVENLLHLDLMNFIDDGAKKKTKNKKKQEE